MSPDELAEAALELLKKRKSKHTITGRTIRNWEHGDHDPIVNARLKAVADVLETTVGALLRKPPSS